MFRGQAPSGLAELVGATAVVLAATTWPLHLAMRSALDEGAGLAASNGGYVDPDVQLGIGAQLRLPRVRVVPEAGVGMGPIGLYGHLGATVFVDFAPDR